MTTWTCPRGSGALYCATWHDCQPWAEREALLAAWAAAHDKPPETPRGAR